LFQIPTDQQEDCWNSIAIPAGPRRNASPLHAAQSNHLTPSIGSSHHGSSRIFHLRPRSARRDPFPALASCHRRVLFLLLFFFSFPSSSLPFSQRSPSCRRRRLQARLFNPSRSLQFLCLQRFLVHLFRAGIIRCESSHFHDASGG